MLIKIAEDFTIAPGGREIAEGPYSGELFRKKLLGPLYEAALETGEKLIVDFDGCFGYATSFLEESFGGLVRERREKGILRNIELISNDDITVPMLINKYVEKAESELK